MSQQVPETRDEGVGQWLPLTEYSVRAGVSLSTIRRKIKSNSIPFKLEKGKYLILFSGESPSSLESPKNSVLEKAPAGAPGPIPAPKWDGLMTPSQSTGRAEQPHRDLIQENSDSIKMVTDAFEHALREKDAHIRLLEKRNQELEDRLNELKLLVKVLEEKYEVRY